MTAQERCSRYRKRILEISQQVSAAHVASAFSCIEIVDCIYNRLLNANDTFLMSKGHGCLAQYVILEELGVLTPRDLELYCKPGGRLGAHPDYGVPGIAASTGSLGHGLAMGVGMALAERNLKLGGTIYVVLSDGELQEGSTWEAIMQASSFRLGNLVVMVDNNDFESLARISESHPSFYPLLDKFRAFGWRAYTAHDGHNSDQLFNIAGLRNPFVPFALLATTTKGKGVSYMENNPIWHYRSPNKEEYQQALKELNGA